MTKTTPNPIRETLFNTTALDAVKICLDYFSFDLPSSIVEKRRNTFVARCDKCCY